MNSLLTNSVGLLKGIRIADFTWIGAGSYTTKMLADAGAEVIKIESATRPDSLRNAAPFANKTPGINRSGYFSDRNSSKKSITLNLKDPRGLALAKEIIAQSDVVANNFAAGTMAKLGLDYDTVKAIRSDIIYLDMSMQGSSGPEYKYIGYGLTIAALTGLQFLGGLPDRAPVGTGTNYPDHIPNPTHAAFALLAALRHRRKTGVGQYIDMAQTEPTLCLLGPAFLNLSINHAVTTRQGNDLEGSAPHGVYRCAGEDQWIAIAASTNQAWKALVTVLGARFPDAWEDQTNRWKDRKALDEALQAYTISWSKEALMLALQEKQVAAGVVNSPAEVILDPQLLARNHWRRLDHPEMGNSLYNAPPYQFSHDANELRSPAPLLGQHTQEVCLNLLNLEITEIKKLQAEGVLR